MALTDEAKVRAKFQLTDTTLVPTALVTGAIDDAHSELVRFLDPDVDTVSPEDALVMGETLLAGAHLFRSLASKEAFDQTRVRVGQATVYEGQRFGSLEAVAAFTAKQAWYVLEPYVTAAPSRTAADATETRPVLGEA